MKVIVHKKLELKQHQNCHIVDSFMEYDDLKHIGSTYET